MLEPVEGWDVTYGKMTDLLARGVPHSFSKWGDGEFGPVLLTDARWRHHFAGKRSVSCGKHSIIPEMCEALKRVLVERPTYMIGISPHTLDWMGAGVREFIAENNLGDISWCNANALHGASRAGTFRPYVDIMRRRKVVIVGPPHLASLSNRIPVAEFVTIPAVDCWKAANGIYDRCLKAAAAGDVFMVSAGPVAKWLIHELHKKVGHSHTLIDAGAVWDVYAGVNTRSYHSGVNLEQLSPT
jgi:hypothetical protein